MKLSETTVEFVNMCQKDGKRCAITIWLNGVYTIDSKVCRLDEVVYNELKNCDLIKIIFENDKYITITGLENTKYGLA